MAKRFTDAGFAAADVRVLIPPKDSTKGNLVVRYRARSASKDKPILLLAHLDVVAALRSDWPRDLLRPRVSGRQGDGGDLRRESPQVQS
jgi:acetylornithine deacetylase/succinyl-diaminopimelate desuccinylase-like protein